MANVADSFRGLPIEELIGGPLVAACEANKRCVQSTADFIQTVGLEKVGESMQARQINFSAKRPVDKENGEVSEEDVVLGVPLLSIVPIPNLQVDNVDVEFSMEVKSSAVDKSSIDTKTEMQAKGGGMFWIPKISITGSVATHKENTRSTDNSARYNVKVTAKQQPPSEGLMKVFDILNSCIAPRGKPA